MTELEELIIAFFDSSSFRRVLERLMQPGGTVPTDPNSIAAIEYAKDFEIG